jgi:hypothetical protein
LTVLITLFSNAKQNYFFVLSGKNFMPKITQIVTFIPRKLFRYTKSLNNFLEAPLAMEHKWTVFEAWVTKVFRGRSSGYLFGTGIKDATVAYACDDGVCFISSCIGCRFDVVQFMGSFVSRPNLTVAITLPGSVACKTFVWSCKNQKLSSKTIC